MRYCKTLELERCLDCIIRDKGLCNALTDEELMRFKRIAFRRTYDPGELILPLGETAAFFSGIVSGVVKLIKVLMDGRQQTVALLFPSDSLGHVLSENNPYFAEAATTVELCCFERNGFERMVDDFPNLKQRLFEQTLDELNSARDWMILLARKTAEEKVASLFLMLATRLTQLDCGDRSEQPPEMFELHLRRDEIAGFLGLTHETVCRQITALRKKGIIQFSGPRRFSVPDLNALTEVAG